MTKKVAILLAEGFEEIEALTVVDILRRANIECDMVSISTLHVVGAHGIEVTANHLISDVVKDYSMMVLPGGMPGATNLRDHKEVIAWVKQMNEAQKFVCAICAAPIVLNEAGVLDGKSYTCYPGFEGGMTKSATFKAEAVVVDGNVITSRGPATVFEFAYTLVQALGENPHSLKQGMLFN